MLNYSVEIDRVLHALADPTRRLIVERLGSGPRTVSELTDPLPMSMPAVVQHLHVLERCGLIATVKNGRTRTCRLDLDQLGTVEKWVIARRREWERRLDNLDEVLSKEKVT